MKTERPLLPQKYTPESLSKLRKEWTTKERASAYDMRIRDIEKIGDLTFLEMGILVLEFEKEEGQLCRELGFKGFTSWMNSGQVKGSRSKRYASRAAVLAMLEINIPADDAALMSRGNAQILAKVSKHNRAALIEPARTMEKRELLRYVEKNFPNEHILDDAPMRLTPDRSQRKTVDACIDAVMLLDPDIKTREDAVESVCAFWMEAHQEELEALVAKA